MTGATSRAVVVFALVLSAGTGWASVDPMPADVENGIRQVRAGELREALVTLSKAAERLARDASHARVAAPAYFWMGVAYVGLGEQDLATARFRQAVELDPGVQAESTAISPEALEVFRTAHRAATTTTTLRKEARRNWWLAPTLFATSGAAAGRVVGNSRSQAPAPNVTTLDRTNNPPTAAFTYSPTGTALACATVVDFAATATDPDGEPLSFHWAFGDGATADAISVSHVFVSSGNYPVYLTVRDGVVDVSITNTVSVATVDGTWRAATSTLHDLTRMSIEQRCAERRLIVTGLAPDYSLTGSDWGYVLPPRSVKFAIQHTGGILNFSGELDSTLNAMTGTLSCNGESLDCNGESLPVRFERE